MCLNPRRIVNPKRKFSQVGGHPLFLYVPCGKCAECQKQKVNEYLLRSYYESLDCFNHGGFVLFDTLTYSNDNVRYLSDFFDVPKKFDFMCFSYMDWRLFMVRLRERLTSEGFVIKDKLKYFVAAEYGTSEGHSHRPHLHPVFYVSFDIDPFYFSRCIGECWSYGRTDGIPFQSRLYVLNKRLFSLKYNPDLVHLQLVTSYVTKYICKDSAYQKRLDSKLDSYFDSEFGSSWHSDSDSRELRSQMARYTSQFHRQSHGFGISALQYNNIDDVIRTGMLSMPDSKLIVKRIPIPTYFARKLFYTLIKDFRGKPQWQLSPNGCQMMLNKFSDSVKRFTFKMQDWYDSLHVINPDGCDFIRSRCSQLLENRSFEDFSTYILAFKGRLLPIDWHNSFPPSVDYILPLSFEEGAPAYLYNSFKEPISKPCVSSVWYGDKVNPLPVPKSPLTLPLSDYAHKRIITQCSFAHFRNFDDLFDLYASSLYNFNISKQSGFDLRQHLTDVYKSLQTNNKPFV